MVVVVRRKTTEHESKKDSEKKDRSKVVCSQMQAEGTIYFSCQMKSTLWFFSDGFTRELSYVLMIECMCLFMFMMQVMSGLNECCTINRSLNA